MKTMIVYVDDAEYARKMLLPLLPTDTATSDPSTRWLVVACTPAVTHDIGKWVSPEALTLWREDWAAPVFSQITPLLARAGDTVTTHIASHKRPLIEQTQTLTQEHGAAQVLDARRPKFGQDLEPVTATQPQENNSLSRYVTAVAGAGLLVALD
jgi:hypothetical protein